MHSLKLQHYWSLTIRLFNAKSRTHVGCVWYLCRDAVGVFYQPSWLGLYIQGSPQNVICGENKLLVRCLSNINKSNQNKQKITYRTPLHSIYIYLLIYLSNALSVSVSLSLSLYIYIFWPTYLSLCSFLSLFIHIYLSIYLFIYILEFIHVYLSRNVKRILFDALKMSVKISVGERERVSEMLSIW